MQPYKLNKAICLMVCGRKPKQFTKEEIEAVLDVKKQTGFGAVNIEKVLSEKDINISHSRIHIILLENGHLRMSLQAFDEKKWGN